VGGVRGRHIHAAKTEWAREPIIAIPHRALTFNDAMLVHELVPRQFEFACFDTIFSEKKILAEDFEVEHLKLTLKL
jgi:hypothetical protein